MILALLQAVGPATASELIGSMPRAVSPSGTPGIGGQIKRMADENAVVFALFQLETEGKAISVTFGRRKKDQRTLYMTPEQGRTMAEVIGRHELGT